MKAAIRSFLEYSLVERTALIILGGLLLILVLIRCSLAWWLRPAAPDPRQAAALRAEYRSWLERQHPEETGVPGPALPAERFVFDPNTLDSTGFIRLGMPPRAVRGLLNWRRKGKRFRSADDLRPLYNLPAEVYARLAPLVRIQEPAYGPAYKGGAFRRETPPAVIELNTADSATLDKWVPGIGPVLAHKIVARREALGGYLDLAQLQEVYRFPDSSMEKLRSRLQVNTSNCRLLNLNAATPGQLAQHPYIGEKLAQNIVMYREALGGYTEITQLRQVPLMTAEIYRKIAPYFSPPQRS